MTIFDDLLGVKRFRESQAEMAVVRQRQRQIEAELQRDEARQRLAAYRQWAREREIALYRDLCAHMVQVRDIENVLREVATFRQQEREHEQNEEDARGRVERETTALAECRQHHQDATRVTSKFVELAQTYLENELKVLENKEELETEDVFTVARDRDEWALHEEYEPA